MPSENLKGYLLFAKPGERECFGDSNKCDVLDRARSKHNALFSFL